MAVAVAGAFSLDMDKLDIGVLLDGTVTVETSTVFTVDINGEDTSFLGAGFTYNALGNPTGGTVTQLHDIYLGQQVYDISGFAIPATQFLNWAATGDTASAKQAIFAGADTFTGSAGDDVLRSLSGNDSVN